MPEDQFKAFLEAVKGDTSLRLQLQASPDLESVVAIAKKAGFSISSTDLNQSQSEISEQELEGAAGGIVCSCLLRLTKVGTDLETFLDNC